MTTFAFISKNYAMTRPYFDVSSEPNNSVANFNFLEGCFFQTRRFIGALDLAGEYPGVEIRKGR